MKNALIILPLIQPLKDPANFQEETAKELAKKNLVFLYDHINIQKLTKKRTQPIWEKLGKNLYLVRPLHLLPFERYTRVYNCNRILWLFLVQFFGKIILRKARVIFWLFHPSLVWVTRARKYFQIFSPLFLYDCVDFFSVNYFSTKKSAGLKFKKNEREMIVSADIVVANSQTLTNYCKQFRNDVKKVPQGFRLETFQHPDKSQINLKKIANGKPIIGYVGGINHRLDLDLLTELVANNPQWQFVFWGPIELKLKTEAENDQLRQLVERLLAYKNVFQQSSSHNIVPTVIRQFDIGIIPYVGSDFNKYCFPTKLFEYFYAGLPVVSSKIDEVLLYPKLATVCRSVKNWQKSISYILSKEWPKNTVCMQKMIAIENSWLNKITRITSILDKYETK